MALEIPKEVQVQRPQPEGSQFRFLINLVFGYWRVILASMIAGGIVFCLIAFYLKRAPERAWTTYADLEVRDTLWNSEIMRNLRPVQVLPVKADGLVAYENKEAVVQDVVEALVQRDLADGGPYSRLVTKDEVRAKVAEMMGKLRIEAVPNTSFIRITAENCETAREAEDLAEFGARVFLRRNRELHIEEGREAHRFIKARLEELQERLSRAEIAEWEYKKEVGFRAYGNVAEELAEMEREMAGIDATRSTIAAKLEEVHSELRTNREQFSESLGNVTDSVVDTLIGELDSLLEEKITMSTSRTPQHPEMLALEEQIVEKQQAILDAEQQTDTGIPGGSDMWQRRKSLREEELNLRLQLTAQEIRSQALRTQFNEMIPKIPDLAEKKLQADKLAQETKRIRKEFDTLFEQEWELRTMLGRGAGQLERHRSVKSASVIDFGMVGGRFWTALAIGLAAGGFISLMLVLMWEVNDTSIRSIEDVNQYLGLEVLGTIPQMRFGKPRLGKRRRATYVTTVDEEQIDACIVTQHDPKSPVSEAYRTLRTNFQFATLNLKPRTVMITSAVPGEGKSTTAVNLAVTMADRGLRVLIVDTDLRRPNVHRVLRMERGPGLADLLREGLDTSAVVRPTRVENLHMISSGRVPPNPSELIGSERMSEVMEQLGQDFDLVICDAPSVLVVTDPVLLATHVDTCVMVVTANFARRETIMRANKLLQTANVNIAGVVVNALETTRRNYYYYYYYYEDGGARARKWYHL